MDPLLRAWLHLELSRLTRGVFRSATSDVPLPHPRSLSRAALAAIVAEKGEWTVAAKSDGVRVLLVQCVLMRREYVAAVDRRFLVRVLASRECDAETGVRTVLDTELVCDEYIAHDALVCGGVAVHGRAHAVRQAILRTAVREFDGVSVKPFVALERIGEVARTANADGLIFAKSDAPVTFGSEPAVLKWKPAEACTVDLVLERRKCGAHWTRRASARAADTRTVLAEVALESVGALPAVWEFGYRGGEWVPLRERRDKSVANSDFVVQQTLLNIREAVTLEELHDLFGVSGPASLAASHAPLPLRGLDVTEQPEKKGGVVEAHEEQGVPPPLEPGSPLTPIDPIDVIETAEPATPLEPKPPKLPKALKLPKLPKPLKPPKLPKSLKPLKSLRPLKPNPNGESGESGESGEIGESAQSAAKHEKREKARKAENVPSD